MEYDLNLREYWRIVRKRKFIVLFATFMMGLFSFGIAYMKKPVPVYETTATVKIEKSSTTTGIYLEALSWSGADYLETQASIITSYPIMEKVAKEIGLIDKDLDSIEVRSRSDLINSVLELKDKVLAEREGNSNLINITAQSHDPKTTQKIANTVARVYMIEHTNEVNKRTFESRKFIEDQLEVVAEKLRKAEESVREFRERHKLLSLNSQTASLLGHLTTAEAEHMKVMKAIEEMSFMFGRLKYAKNKPITTKESFYINEASTLYKNLNAKLVALLLEKDTLLLTYTEEYPKIKEINTQVNEIAKNMSAQLAERISVTEKRSKSIKAKIDDLQQELKRLPDKGLKLARLERDVQLNEKVYSLLESKLQEAKIKEAAKIEEVVIVKPALEPNSPIESSQVKLKAFMGAVIGFIIGLVFAFVYETFDTSIGAIKEIEEFVGLSVLGVIPAIDIKEIKEVLKKIYKKEDFSDVFLKRKSRLLTHFMPNSTSSECYRAMRTNVQFAGLDKQLKTIAFTSAVANEGKSTTIVNAAIAMAQAQNKVLLVEGDLRKPVISRWFGVEPLPGLTDVILGSYGWHDAVRTITDIMLGEMDVEEVMLTPGLDNLHIIPCGHVPPNPAELLNSKNLTKFLDEVKAEYDVILIDLPPILSAAESAIVSANVDAVVMVYKAGKTARGALRRAKDQLEHANANIMGIVLNELKAEISSDYTDIDYHRYYGYEEEKGAKKPPWVSLPAFLKKVYQRKKSKKRKKAERDKRPLWQKVAIVLCAFIMLGIGLFWRETSRTKPVEHSKSSPHKKIVKEERQAVNRLSSQAYKDSTTRQLDDLTPPGPDETK
ncbi:MAG: polysaccharide biosynthesis tyrosine autokinase [Pseudomonadota bacterium]